MDPPQVVLRGWERGEVRAGTGSRSLPPQGALSTACIVVESGEGPLGPHPPLPSGALGTAGIAVKTCEAPHPCVALVK